MIELFHGDCRRLKRIIENIHFDVQISDPPYSEHVHQNAVSCSAYTGGKGARARDLNFDPLSTELADFVGWCSSKVARWSLLYSDVESAQDLARVCESFGSEYVRQVPWIRWSMPQLSNDRPCQGYEAVVLVHAPRAKGVRMSWDGPGNMIALRHKCLRGAGKHPTEKPLDQALDLVSWFSAEGETVLDLTAGLATVGLACRLLNREYLGAEVDASYAERAQERLDGPLSKRDRERVGRWTERTQRRLDIIGRQKHKFSIRDEMYIAAANKSLDLVLERR